MQPAPSARIRSSDNLEVRYIAAGNEQTPVIIIDDFVAALAPLIEFACRDVRFGIDRSASYPGLRAGLPRSYVKLAIGALSQVLRRTYDVPAELEMVAHKACYSLITRRESELKMTQCMPHFDSVAPFYFALTHYLNPGEFGGTGLFRHKPTGFENINAGRLDRYLDAGAAFRAAHGPPARGYIVDSDAQFELFGSVAYRPNRLIAYPGTLLHSGLVKAGRDINPDPLTGRLTANLFLEFRPVAAGQ